MKRLHVLSSILGGLVAVISVSIAIPKPTVSGYEPAYKDMKIQPRMSDADATSTNPFDTCHPKLFRSVAPKWMTVQLDGYAVTIPYSNDWRSEDTACMFSDTYSRGAVPYGIYKDTSSETPRQAIWFGRPADVISDITPEYDLSREPVTPRLLDTRPGDEWTCGDTRIISPLEMTVAGLKGWRYFTGGIKWCSMIFQFQKGDYVYSLERNLEPSLFTTVKGDKNLDTFRAWASSGITPPAEIDQEMRKIIGSIKDHE